MSGRFVWFDLVTPDPDAAVAFYTRLMGWTPQTWPGETPYTMFQAGDTGIGGVVPLSGERGGPPHWLGYVGVDDVDGAVARATSHGARVLAPPRDVEGAGRYATLADPQGAVFAVYQSTPPSPAEPDSSQPGEVRWVELYTSDWRAGFSFYEAVFGWQKTEAMEMGPMGTYQMFNHGSGRSVGGIMNRPPGVEASTWSYYFHVDDVHARAKLAESLGAKITVAPMEVPGGDWISMGIDPQGAAFAIHSTKPA